MRERESERERESFFVFCFLFFVFFGRQDGKRKREKGKGKREKDDYGKLVFGNKFPFGFFIHSIPPPFFFAVFNLRKKKNKISSGKQKSKKTKENFHFCYFLYS